MQAVPLSMCVASSLAPLGVAVLHLLPLAVSESSTAVAEYLMGQYDNFLQFAGQKTVQLVAPRL